MAIVILCGLVTSTFLNMIVVPTQYLRYGRLKVRAADEPAANNNRLGRESEMNRALSTAAATRGAMFGAG
jgi:hypothetical protein